ncbi:MAG: hypothetical protein IPK00_16100 [Deltaproteobacteria bacterium]|nr:hypothetical protein [Deltaproteobacteria bacterium]
MKSYEALILERADEGRTCIVRLKNRRAPQRTVAADGGELNDALAQLDQDDSVRVIVLTGAGSTFCVGADLSDAGPLLGSRGAEIRRAGGRSCRPGRYASRSSPRSTATPSASGSPTR